MNDWSGAVIAFGMFITVTGMILLIVDRYMAKMPEANIIIFVCGLFIMFISGLCKMCD